MVYVKIISCRDNTDWYRNNIDEIFEVDDYFYINGVQLVYTVNEKQLDIIFKRWGTIPTRLSVRINGIIKYIYVFDIELLTNNYFRKQKLKQLRCT
jgi:hypothetical protein